MSLRPVIGLSKDERAAQALDGGRIYLHEKQNTAAWHGGKITSWRKASDSDRKVFVYEVDGPFRIKCESNWSQESAFLKRT